MQSIEKHNAKLAQLTTSSKELEPFRRRRKPLTNLRYLKDLAKSLFEALQKGLKSGHSPNANLHLASEQSLIGNAIAEEEVLRKVQFRVIVSYKGHSPQDRVPIWEDIDVRLLEAAKVATGMFLISCAWASNRVTDCKQLYPSQCHRKALNLRLHRPVQHH